MNELVVRFAVARFLGFLEDKAAELVESEKETVWGVPRGRVAQILLEELQTRPLATAIFDGSAMKLLTEISVPAPPPERAKKTLDPPVLTSRGGETENESTNTT